MSFRKHGMLSAAVLLLAASLGAEAQLTVIRVCVPVDVDPVGCDATFNATLNAAATSMGVNVYFDCRVGFNVPTCSQMVETGQADITKTGGEDMYRAFADFNGLYPFASEDYQNGPAGVEYSPIMLSFCDAYTPGTGFGALRNRRLCSTGYRKTAGWAVPVGAMVASLPQFLSGLTLDNPNVVNDAEVVANFFSGGVCAPRFTPGGPFIDPATGVAARWTGLCSACDITQPDTTYCYDNRPAFGKDKYADYAGALQCLVDGRGDVAFLKHTTPLTNLSTALQSNYRLFCPNTPSGPPSGCATVDNWATCSMGQVRAHSFMGRKQWTATVNWVSVMNNVTMGSAASKAGLVSLNVFTSDALGVVSTPAGLNFPTWFGNDTMAAMAAYRSLDRLTGLPQPAAAAASTPRVRICVPADVTQAACDAAFTNSLNQYALSNNINVSFVCRIGFNPAICSEMVQSGAADLVRVGGDDLFTAYEDFGGLRPYLAEAYTTAGPLGAMSYYSVAMVQKSVCDTTPGINTATSFTPLRGKKLCSTGYRKTAGWSVPVGIMAALNPTDFAGQSKTIADVVNDAEAVAGFFSGGVCAPRFTSYGPRIDPVTEVATLWPAGLCNNCKQNQSANKFCMDDGGSVNKDDYADYAGSLRCMVDGAADVAFTKHSTPLENLTPAQQDNFRLFCPGKAGGSCQPLTNFLACNLSPVRSHAFVGRPNWAFASTPAWQQAITAISAVASTPALRNALTIGGTRTVFSSDAVGAQAVTEPFPTWAGLQLGAFDAMRALSAGAAPVITVAPTTTVVRLCVPVDISPVTCSAIFNRTLNARAAALGQNVYFECKVGFSVSWCSQLIRDNAADMVKLGSGDMFNAFTDFSGLRPYGTEDYMAADVVAGIEYYSVMMVKREFCDATPAPTTLASLKGKKLCSTGYRKSAGWSVPVATLYNNEPSFRNGITDNPDVANDADAVASFFGGVCAPRYETAGPYRNPWTGLMDVWRGSKTLCSLCDQTQSPSDFCYDNVGARINGTLLGRDKYADYAGNIQCMQDGVGDVAFTKHSTPLTMSTADQAKYRLFCPGATSGGACQPLSSYPTCNLGGVRAHGYVGRAVWALPSTPAWAQVLAVLSSAAGEDALRAQLVPLAVFTRDTRAVEAVTRAFPSWFGPTLMSTFGSMRTLAALKFPAPVDGAKDDTVLDPGIIAAIVIGVAVAGALLGCCIYMTFMRVRGAKYVLERDLNGARGENLQKEAGRAGDQL